MDRAILNIAMQADSPAPRPRASAPEDSPQFSYALAAASLERQASASLNAHGAAPDAEIGTAQKASAQSSSAATPRGGADAVPSNATGETSAPTVAAKAPVSPPPSQAIGATSAAPTIRIVMTPAGAATAAPSPTAAAQATGARDAAGAARTSQATTKVARPQDAPNAPTVEFAKTLAARIEKTSVFDIRLDPPELGRVDGRLSVDDDGKAVLSLAFDNRNAFDLFSRDQAALRQALVQAGLNFGGGDFVFAFKERAASDAPAFDADISATKAARGYDPIFTAAWSAGALDIRI